MGNTDETTIFFYIPANTTVDTKGSKSVLVKTKHKKLRITVLLSVMADGRRLALFVTLKRKNLPKEKLPTGVICKCNEKEWIMEELVVKWLRKIWRRRPGVPLKERGMLVLDAFRGHLTDKLRTVASNY
jgi:hypothetical protein